ncbi:MAG TPA: BlaI/MecI/CopY family transcriptional regulator [Sediminibacterium sp.]|nr:BlaI/MecI/CopY family transcriptional regulator [Sediminibacterium sp.]
MKLTKSEEEIMALIWQHRKVFLKEILDALPEPKPAATTVATLLKRMTDKGFVAYHLHGHVREYYPLVEKEKYYSREVKGIIRNSFNDSAVQFASFFTHSANLSMDELKALRKLIDLEIQKKKK